MNKIVINMNKEIIRRFHNYLTSPKYNIKVSKIVLDSMNHSSQFNSIQISTKTSFKIANKSSNKINNVIIWIRPGMITIVKWVYRTTLVLIVQIIRIISNPLPINFKRDKLNIILERMMPIHKIRGSNNLNLTIESIRCVLMTLQKRISNWFK